MHLSLNERQNAVFSALLKEYLTTAKAVGSTTLARRLGKALSPASVRNVMSDLEELGLLNQPHTSAGRTPTTLGYGYYVDSLMRNVTLPIDDKAKLAAAFDQVAIGGAQDILEKAGEALARTSALISVVLAPTMAEGILHKLDLIKISSERLLVVITIRNGFVRSIMLEIASTLTDLEIESAKRLMNERLGGLTLDQVRNTIYQRLAGTEEANAPLLKMMVDSADKIFCDKSVGEIHVEGTRNAMEHPEFSDMNRMKGVIEILEDKDVILHMLQRGNHETLDGVRISIGDELEEYSLEGCSVVTAEYSIGQTKGSLGIIGPTRMDYPRLASLVNYTAKTINSRVMNS